MASSVCKYTEFLDEPGSTHNRVVDLVPEGSRVLEFGCATGYMTEVLKDRRGCTVTGVEISPEAAKLAEQHAERVIVGDAEELEYEELFADERFDAILFADVLEHLRDPGALLTRIRPLLVDEGVIIASLPNVAHGSVRLALLAGEFRYRELGLLDESHLRFFTRESIQDLFEAAGYVVHRWLRQRLDVEDSEISLPVVEFPDELRAWLSSDPDVTTYQYVVEAFRSDEAGQLRAAKGAANDRLQRRAEEQSEQLEALQERVGALQERIDFLAGREQELQALLREAHDRLLRRDEETRRRSDAEIRERASLEQQLRETNHVIHMMQSTRIWRLGHAYWQARDVAKRLRRRR